MPSENYRIVEDAHVYFVTFSIVEWLPVFVSEAACQIVTDSLNFCRSNKSLCTSAFVIMPTHLHAIVHDQAYNNERMARAMTDFRKFTGRAIADHCAEHMPACFNETLRQCSPSDRQRRCWQPSRHPVAIENEFFWNQKANYLHDNPRRKGLVHRGREWRFSSAAFYESDGQADCDVEISPLDWT